MAADLSGCLVNGRYNVDKKIQSGYYGTTWLAIDKLKSVEVCLKTFFHESKSQQKELSILKKLVEGQFSHENLCAVLDISVNRAPVASWKGEVVFHTQYVVFEYCSGTDLFNFLVTGPFEKLKRVSGFPEALARHYFTQALLAVMYLHERGVFHRDIKPENCVLDHNFNLKLTDFGTNKMLPSPEPGKLLRASTKGVGTDSYRAPEVNGVDYDPSAADVWSLGVTLLFMVGIEQMVARVQQLDQFVRQVVAPLGILFPFPYHCRLLDTYMRSSGDIAAAKERSPGQTVSQIFPNQSFWSEWSTLRDALSPNLLDLFNWMFVLCPSHRGVLRDLARHPWVSGGHRLSPDEIAALMKERCPSNIVMSQHASPSVVASKLLGGVDQATLRQSLSTLNNMTTPTEYLSDAEVWTFSSQLRDMEGLQQDIINSDIQEIMMDISFCRQVLRDILQEPCSERSRSVPVSNIQSSWVTQMLSCVGFLPQGRLLYLMQNSLDLRLIQSALGVLEGVELAVARGVVSTTSDDEEGEEMMTDPTPSSQGGQVSIRLNNPSSCSVDSGVLISNGSSSQPHSTASLDTRTNESFTPPLFPSPMESFEGQSSQESNWTGYTNGGDSLSAQSSQESLPEAMVEARGSQDYANNHYLMQLTTVIDRHKPQQYKAAGEFCKMSGLLCSYGLYQVVSNEQMALYCRGSTTSFSARVVCMEEANGKIGISSWCFQGNEEWIAILLRLSNDMTPQL